MIGVYVKSQEDKIVILLENLVLDPLLCHLRMFENYSQCVAFEVLHFPPIFGQLKGGAFLVTLFDRKLQVFKSSPKWTTSTQNVNVAPFAQNIECDFLGNVQTLWVI